MYHIHELTTVCIVENVNAFVHMSATLKIFLTFYNMYCTCLWKYKHVCVYVWW